MQRIVYGVLKRVGSFRFRAPAEDFDVSTGDYLLIHSTKMRFLGQVEETRDEFVLEARSSEVTTASRFGDNDSMTQRDTTMVPKSQVEASGRVLCALGAREAVLAVALDFDVGDRAGGVGIEMAPDEVVHSYVAKAFRTEGPMLRVGALLGVSESVPVRLDPAGFKRPTGLFGQTGAGKSYALGVIVEELILQTKVNVVVLDPNGDFVRFKDKLRELEGINDHGNLCSLTQKALDAYQKVHDEKINHATVLSADPSLQGASRRFLRLSDLDQREVAAALGLDRVADPEDYHYLQVKRDALKSRGGGGEPYYGVEELEKSIDRTPVWSSPATTRSSERLGRALRNSHLKSLRIWGSGSGDESTLVSLLRDDEVQVVIIDLSRLERLERALVASVVFRTLFEIQEDHRHKKDGKCTVLVLDEAHHLFPQKALFPEQELTVDWGSRIAGEGRKYGLYLIVASQLPSKVHEHVLTQCGNLVLMKMASQSDIDALRDSFSFVPGSLLERSKWFEKGEALAIGDIVPAPSCLLHFEGRKTQEGGRDLKVDWGEDLRLTEG